VPPLEWDTAAGRRRRSDELFRPAELRAGAHGDRGDTRHVQEGSTERRSSVGASGPAGRQGGRLRRPLGSRPAAGTCGARGRCRCGTAAVAVSPPPAVPVEPGSDRASTSRRMAATCGRDALRPGPKWFVTGTSPPGRPTGRAGVGRRERVARGGIRPEVRPHKSRTACREYAGPPIYPGSTPGRGNPSVRSSVADTSVRRRTWQTVMPRILRSSPRLQ